MNEPIEKQARKDGHTVLKPSLPKLPKIDLYSDTITRPTPAMRQAMAEAIVGDEQYREDPTTLELEAKVAELLGKEAAVFLPSGTMCNQIAIRVHCTPGDEILMDRTAHALNFESGGPAALSGAMVRSLDGVRGIFSAAQLEEAIRKPSRWAPRSSLVVIEQTSNGGGGSVWPLTTIREVCGVAKKSNLKIHMDGARLLNAQVATGIPASEYASEVDSVWIDFSKGLGAPVGACLAGTSAFIEQAWRFKHQFGGAMRQSGIIAAGALFALDNHVSRLVEDHENAKHLACGLEKIVGISVEPVETNMVFFNVTGLGLSSSDFAVRLLERGLRVLPKEAGRIRTVLHLDVTRAQIEEGIEIVGEVARRVVGN